MSNQTSLDERGRAFAQEKDMTPEEALGFLLEKTGLDRDPPSVNDEYDPPVGISQGQLIRGIVAGGLPLDAPANISIDRKGRTPFEDRPVACLSVTHHPVSGVSYAFADRTPDYDEQGEFVMREPEHKYKEVTIHCHEDVREVLNETPYWFPQYRGGSDYFFLDEAPE